MQATMARTVAALVAALTVAACGGDVGNDSASTSKERASKVDKLRALPYVDFTPDPADTTLNGTIFFDEARSYPGYTFYTVRNMAMAELIEADGSLIQRWEGPEGHFVRAVLMEDGGVLAVGKDDRRYAMRMNWDGEVVWRQDIEAHHDIGMMEDGRVVLLTLSTENDPRISTDYDYIDDQVQILAPEDGRLIESRSLTKMLLDGGFEFTRVEPARSQNIDLLHSNSVRWMTQEHLFDRDPIYARGNIIVSMRHQDTVAIFEWQSGELLWHWGQGILGGQHDAWVLDNGNLLIFDNGLGRDWSRVIEVDPLKKEIVWQYGSEDMTDFYTNGRGASQRLPNGNTLITESADGRAFEVTRDGELVWEYYCPYTNDKGQRATFIRCYRLENDFVQKILAQH